MQKRSPVRRKSIIKADSPRLLANSRNSSGTSRFSPYQKSQSPSPKGRTFIQSPPASGRGRVVTNKPSLALAPVRKPSRRTRAPERVIKKAARRMPSEKHFCNKSDASASEIWLMASLLLRDAELNVAKAVGKCDLITLSTSRKSKLKP